jgi:hypothetical protein
MLFFSGEARTAVTTVVAFSSVQATRGVNAREPYTRTRCAAGSLPWRLPRSLGPDARPAQTKAIS